MPLADHLAVPHGTPFRLADLDPRGKDRLQKHTGAPDSKEAAQAALETDIAAIADLQYRLWAENRRALLLILQGMDTSGKDGVVRHVFSGVNPTGVRVTSFKKPSEIELDHDFLWRIHAATPARGEVGIFNRSHYEDVLVVRVHGLVPEPIWRARYETINAFESLLASGGTTIVKCFLHISRDEQRRRLKDRLEEPDKRWKFQEADIEERKHWDDYQAAYEDALTRCSTPIAPWLVIPSDHKWLQRWAIGRVVRETLEGMGPRIPKPRIDVSRMTMK